MISLLVQAGLPVGDLHSRRSAAVMTESAATLAERGYCRAQGLDGENDVIP